MKGPGFINYVIKFNIMTELEKKLAVHYLNEHSTELGENCCNDVDEDVIFKDWTLEERKKFVKEYHDYNGDPEEYDEDFLHIPDFAIVSFLAHKLKNL